mgnify:CR=1 FL=1
MLLRFEIGGNINTEIDMKIIVTMDKNLKE